MVKKPDYFRMILKNIKNLFFTVVWWSVLGLDALFYAFFVTILPQRLRNGISLRMAVSVLLKVAGVKVVIQGLENIDKNHPQVFVANHQSWFDSFVLSASLPVPLSFTSKKEMFRIPIYSYIMRRLGFISINRVYPKSALKKNYLVPHA